MSGTNDKEYNENEVDLVEEKNKQLEQKINEEVLFRKEIRIRRNLIHDTDIKEIHKRYGYDVVEEHLIKQGISKVIPLKCSKCKIMKCFPYEFLTKTNKDNGFNHCSVCMSESSSKVQKSVKNNTMICQCGMSVFCSDLTLSKHEVSNIHFNRLKQKNINNGSRIYNLKELRIIGKVNHIKYCNTLNTNDMIKEILMIDTIIIPEDLK